MNAIFHYVLAILEGGLSWACFRRARRWKQRPHKAILYAAGALWLAASVLDVLEGGREQMLEINGGKEDE